MSDSLRILHLVRENESVPDVLREVTTHLQTLPAGLKPDAAAKFFQPQIITICGPFDHEARTAIELVIGLNCPAVGIGEGTADFVSATASALVPAQDLLTILELAASLHTCENPIVANEHTRAEVERALEETVRTLEHLMDLRIPGYTERAQRIYDTCLWIGNHLCLQAADLKELLLAARLREIGKLGLPDTLLFSKLEARSTEQREIYNSYAAQGASVLAKSRMLRGAGRLIASMLENFDGSGPQGLIAHQIPLGSRILRVAGACEMIRASRSNVGAIEIVEKLNRVSGSLYDPLLVKLFENYTDISAASAAGVQTNRVRISDLAPGMILAEDMWSRNGMKIIAKGTRLSAHTLKILFHYPLDPSLEAVEVMKDNGM